MAATVVKVPTAHFNLSPAQLRVYAAQDMECHRAFRPPSAYSPVPYFLLCRSIESGRSGPPLSRTVNDALAGLQRHAVAGPFDRRVRRQTLKSFSAMRSSVSELLLRSSRVLYSFAMSWPNSFFTCVRDFDSRCPAFSTSSDTEESDVLKAASAIYVDKGFEYVSAWDGVTGLKHFPNLGFIKIHDSQSHVNVSSLDLAVHET
jgi:hypothetical protein